MLKLITAIIPFAKELFFDRKEEMDFKSPHFNVKKWVQYVAFVLLFVLILFVGGRLFTIATKYTELNEEYVNLQADNKKNLEKITNLTKENGELKRENTILNRYCGELKTTATAKRKAAVEVKKQEEPK